MNNHIAVPGFKADPTTVKVLCPYCSCLHTHGRSPGNRVPHCFNKQNLPEYNIILLGILMPREAIRIDQKARRLHRVLQNHQHSNRITGSSKPDTAYLQEIAVLAAEVQAFNERVLEEVRHAE